MTRVSVHVAQSSGERSHTLIFKIRTFRCPCQVRIRRHISPSLPGWLRATADWSPTGRSQKDWGSGEHARCVEQHPQHGLCRIAGCVGHTSVHSDRGWPSCLGVRRLCGVSQQQQQPNLPEPCALLVFPVDAGNQKVSKLPGKTWNSDGEIIRYCDAPFSDAVGTWHRRQLKAVAPRSLGGARVPSIAVEGTGT
jgi:hypothetical protein